MVEVRAERASTPPDEILLGFTRALRAAGVPVTQDRAQGFLDAAATIGLTDPPGVHAAGRATLCGSPDDLLRYEQVFAAWFGDEPLPQEKPQPTTTSQPVLLPTDADGGDAGADGETVRTAASDAEVLRHRDVAALSVAERQRINALLATLRPRSPRRRVARRTPWHRGRIDAARTLRASLRQLGEPAEIHMSRRGTGPRRVILLIDISGSMSGYADTLLRLAHRISHGPGAPVVETFTLGTRLTHLTKPLRARDPERALIAAGEAVPDWSGGTRLGETLQAFLDRWGRRGMARGAVVVIFSDGWERGDTALLDRQLARLQLLAHRLVWVNPHRGKTGYEPVQAGIRTALPHLDHFLAGHSLATYQELTEVIADA